MQSSYYLHSLGHTCLPFLFSSASRDLFRRNITVYFSYSWFHPSDHLRVFLSRNWTWPYTHTQHSHSHINAHKFSNSRLFRRHASCWCRCAWITHHFHITLTGIAIHKTQSLFYESFGTSWLLKIKSFGFIAILLLWHHFIYPFRKFNSRTQPSSKKLWLYGWYFLTHFYHHPLRKFEGHN